MSVADDVVKELHGSIARTLESFRGELATVRTGRASLHMLDGVRVDYYGTATPLNQVATLSVPEPRLIVAKPWEKALIPVIEKAIRDANLGLNPMSDKDMVRVPVPPLTEERRREIVKQVKHKGEEFKVSIRNERRDAKELLEAAEKDGDCSADEVKKALEKVQKETDEGVKKIGEDPDKLPSLYASLINECIKDRPANMSVCTHLCRGNFASAWVAEGGYDPVAAVLFNELKVDGYFLEFDTPRAGNFAPLRYMPKDKKLILGLVTSKTGELEKADDIKRRIDEAAQLVPLDQLGISPQCGFSSTVLGNKLTVNDQIAKLKLIVDVARDVWGSV